MIAPLFPNMHRPGTATGCACEVCRLQRLEEFAARQVASIHGYLTTHEAAELYRLRRVVGYRWDATNRRWTAREPDCGCCGMRDYLTLDVATGSWSCTYCNGSRTCCRN